MIKFKVARTNNMLQVCFELTNHLLSVKVILEQENVNFLVTN